MKEIIIQLVTAALGSVGFALLFQVKSKLLPAAAIGGALSWGIYLLMFHATGSIFFSSGIASAAGALLAEAAARIWKMPSTCFFMPIMMPLFPGGVLYYTMDALLHDSTQAAAFGLRTAQWALGISAGIGVIWALIRLEKNIRA